MRIRMRIWMRTLHSNANAKHSQSHSDDIRWVKCFDECVSNAGLYEYCRATRRVGTRAGRRARVGARSDHWICWSRASLARQRDYRPRSCWTVDIFSGKPPALYLTCRQATHLGTTQHTGYISPSVATSADRRNTSAHQRRPSPKHTHTLRRTLSPSASTPDTAWTDCKLYSASLYPLGCPDQPL